MLIGKSKSRQQYFQKLVDEFLYSPDIPYRLAAANKLSNFEDIEPEVFAKALCAPEPRIRIAAMRYFIPRWKQEYLHSAMPDIIPDLIQDENAEVGLLAILWFTDSVYDYGAYRKLLEHLQSPTEMIKVTAIRLLPAFIKRNPQRIEIFKQLLHDPSREVRLTLIKVWDIVFREVTESPTPVPLELLSEQNVFIVARAIKMLGIAKDQRAIEHLISLLDDHRPVFYFSIAHYAAYALIEIGTARTLSAVAIWRSKMIR